MITLYSYPHKFRITSWIIATVMGRDYSHCCLLAYSQDFSCWLINESAHGEFKPVDFENWSKKNRIVKAYKFNGEVEKKKIRWLAAQFDKTYPYLVLPLIALGIRWQYDGDSKHTCSEIIAKFFELTSDEWVRPSDLDDAMELDSRFVALPSAEVYSMVKE